MIPGPKSSKLSDRLSVVESRNVTYTSENFPVFWESAKGCKVQDVDGNDFLDLTAAFGVASLGHSASVVQKALVQQSKKMWHGMGDVHPNAVKVDLLEKLTEMAPVQDGRVILSSSGAEAVESALKTARLATGKPGVITFEGAYHGLTYGTLALTDRIDFTRRFADQITPLAIQAPYPDTLRGQSEDDCLFRVEQILKRGSQTFPIGAILIEPMQARGGIRIPQPSFIRELFALARAHNVCFIADEIYTGLGRTGRRWAVDHSDVSPDILCTGKALANGFPISAAIGSKAVMDAWPASDGEAIHTSTFLGNPLGCAMALASLNELEQKKLAVRSAKMGGLWLQDLKKQLAEHPDIAEVRGIGLMIGIEVVKDRRSPAPDAERTTQIIKACLKRGVFILGGGKGRNVLSITPPLTITSHEIKKATDVLLEVLK